MGSKTGEFDHGRHSSSLRDQWVLLLATSSGQKRSEVTPDPKQQGWVNNPVKFLELKNLTSGVIPLRPGDSVCPWGPAAKARKMQKDWEQKYNGPVVYLLVPDIAQEDTLSLIQPVPE